MIPDDALLGDIEFTQQWLDRVRRENAKLVELLDLCDELSFLAPLPPGKSAERAASDRKNCGNCGDARADSGDGK